jgi:hypothetical protein
MRRAWPLPRSAGCNRAGKTHGRRGHSGTSRAHGPSSAGSTACPWRPDARPLGMACSSLLVLLRQATKSSSGSGMGSARASSPGKSSGSTAQAAAWRRRPPGPWGRGRGVSGRPYATWTGRRVGSGGGCRRRPRSWPSGPKPARRKPNSACKPSGWRLTARVPCWPWTLQRGLRSAGSQSSRVPGPRARGVLGLGRFARGALGPHAPDPSDRIDGCPRARTDR